MLRVESEPVEMVTSELRRGRKTLPFAQRIARPVLVFVLMTARNGTVEFSVARYDSLLLTTLSLCFSWYRIKKKLPVKLNERGGW